LYYQITHRTTYLYDRPVILAPHGVRLRPRSDVTQSLKAFVLTSNPIPLQITENIDLDGNAILKLWFAEEPTTRFEVDILAEVETHRSNPFSYLLEPWATHLPLDYPLSLLSQLYPYLAGQPAYSTATLDPIAIQLAQEINQTVAGNTVSFLTELNQRVHDRCNYTIRETGDPLPPGITWNQKAGSCRDMTVLFMEVCRAMGLASRFVSGYQEGDPEGGDLHLHAWAEVYLPGGGWRGYDPTQGLAVGDRHIALVASPQSRYTSPISGTLKGNAQATMGYQLKIEIK